MKAGDRPDAASQEKPALHRGSGHLLRRAGVVTRTLLIAYLLVLLMMSLLEETLIFPVSRYPNGQWNPESIGAQDVYFDSADGTRLHGWYLPHESPHAPLLYAHGNGGNITDRGSLVKFLRDRYRRSVFIFDYRGYGRSEGRPNEQGILADARAARSWLARQDGIGESEIVLMGRSLGGAVAANLAGETDAKGLIVESSFTSMPDVAAYHYPWLPVRLIMRTRLDAAGKLAGYRGPLLQSHGTADEVIPFRIGKRLHAAAVGPKKFITIEGGRHNDPQPAEYYEELEIFLDSLAAPSARGLTNRKE